MTLIDEYTCTFNFFVPFDKKCVVENRPVVVENRLGTSKHQFILKILNVLSPKYDVLKTKLNLIYLQNGNKRVEKTDSKSLPLYILLYVLVLKVSNRQGSQLISLMKDQVGFRCRRHLDRVIHLSETLKLTT